MIFFRQIMLIIGLLVPFCVAAQQDTTVQSLDDIQFDVKSAQVEGDTATVALFLISLARGEREFKMNTYASVVEDARYNDHMYSSIQMGRVMVRLEDRQNYLHYLLAQDTPVPLTIKVANWREANGKPTAVRIVFEDSREEGRFREVSVKL